MKMVFKKSLKNYIVVSNFSNNEIIVLKYFSLYLYNIDLDDFTFLYELKTNRILKYLSYFSLISRLLRFNIIRALKISQSDIIIAYQGEIFRFDVYKRIHTPIVKLNGFKRPLYFTLISDDKDSFNRVYYGDYKFNPDKNEISIYYIDINTNKQFKAYIFPKGSINHVHNIIDDKSNRRFLILTGDDDESSCIWSANYEFTKVFKIIGGAQIYRSCFGFVKENKFIYATDSPYIENKLYSLSLNKNLYLQPIFDLEGPIIYGSKSKSDIIFTSTVEGFNAESGNFLKLFDFRRGPGIHSRKVKAYILDENFKIYDFFLFTKDFLPFSIFQFGTAVIPIDLTSSNYIYFTLVGSIFHDHKTIIYKKLELNNSKI